MNNGGCDEQETEAEERPILPMNTSMATVASIFNFSFLGEILIEDISLQRVALI